jgi:signal transduction histidine kinase
VRLSLQRGELRFSVADDGRGFDPRTATPGAGLAGLRDRVETAGGQLEVVTAPGRGTTVAGAVPWPARTLTR